MIFYKDGTSGHLLLPNTIPNIHILTILITYNFLILTFLQYSEYWALPIFILHF